MRRVKFFMMRKLSRRPDNMIVSLLIILLSCTPASLYAQDKNLAYYASHVDEIIPDAQKAFSDARYDKAVEICSFRYIIVGDDAAGELKQKATRCQQLSSEIVEASQTGKKTLAWEKARELLSLNPNDRQAKEVQPYGSLRITSKPSGAVIWLNGKKTDQVTPCKIEDLSSGEYSVKLTYAGYKDYEGSITIAKGEQEFVDIKMDVQELVDLGLSVKWASCNLGASSPEDYGDYYAWGETSTKSNYGWSTYKYCNGSNTTMTKYCNDSSYGYNGFTDNKTVLDLSDDAARVKLGGSWRMPTDEEWTELRTSCTWTWTTQNGVNGYKVTSKTNGNSIFLPAAGFRGDTDLYLVGSYGDYWSSSLYTDDPYYACGVDFDSSAVGRGFSYRCDGQSVRPVYKEYLPVESVSLSKSSLEINEAETYKLAAAVYPIKATMKTVTWTSSNTSVATVSSTGLVKAIKAGTATITVKTQDGNKTATCSVTVQQSDMVDLGLSVKWRNRNLGASTPEGYGDYYAWGETSTKSNYNGSTYKYCNGSETTMTKYCTNSSYGYNGFTDNKTVLDLSDDAARVKLGGSWRLPTDAEWTELRNNCTWVRETQNGVTGYKVTSKTNGNSIFLPAAGCRSGTSLYNVGSRGYYWSSTLYTDYPHDARSVNFYSSHIDMYGGDSRCFGLSIRPVILQVEEEAVEEEAIPFALVETKPMFQGGDANNFSRWVATHLQYPEIAKENGVQGKVTLQFTVNTDGTVSNVKVLSGVHPSLNKEAVRVVSSSPKWTPGKQRDRAVKVSYTFPVIFQLK